MQTLGLASEEKPTDGMLKRLFWPTIENSYDLDLVSQQGFWVCFGVGVLSAVVLIVTGHYFLGALIALTYLLGGTGVRERSVVAAALIFLCYLLDRVVSVVFGFGGGNPLIGIVAMMLLLANVRGTLLAQRWKVTGGLADREEALERSTTSIGDKLSNVVPAAVWPKGRFVFYPLAGLLLVLTAGTLVLVPMQRQKQAELQRQQRDGQIIAVKPAD